MHFNEQSLIWMKYAQERRLSGVLESDNGAADLHKVSALQLISYDISVVTFFLYFLECYNNNTVN